MATKKSKTKRKSSKKASPAKRKKAAKQNAAKGKARKARPQKRTVRGPASTGTLVPYQQRGLGARAGGQAGDTQGLPASPDVDSESVEELAEEGQSFEAEVLEGIENAPDPDEKEVRTREVPEDDVPEEYRGKDE